MSDNLIEIPLVGHVAAGSPILAEEHHESVVHFDANLLRGMGPPSRFACAGTP